MEDRRPQGDVRAFLGYLSAVDGFLAPAFNVPCPDIREARIPTLGPKIQGGHS
jgi:hypothetical protein